MPPQPYKGNWKYTANSIKERPKLAQHIGVIAAKWSQVDLTLGKLFSLILGADAEIGTAMYLAIVSEQARDAAMFAAVERTAHKARFEALIQAMKGPRKMRNTVVHGLWALAEDKPESIVLLDFKNVIRWEGIRRTSPKDHSKWTKALEESTAGLEYKESDFIEIEDAIDKVLGELAKFLHDLHGLVLPEHLRKLNSPKSVGPRDGPS